jgi:hypothetical protein
MEASEVHQEDKKHEKLVEVVLITVDEESGDQVEEEKSVEKGETKVKKLKDELGVEAELALWSIDKHGKRKRLGDHETYDVKKGDRFVVIRPGGVS